MGYTWLFLGLYLLSISIFKKFRTFVRTLKHWRYKILKKLWRLIWYNAHMIQQQALPASLKSFKNNNIFTGQSLSSYYLDHWFSSKVVSEFWEIFSFDRDLLPSFLPWFTSNRPAISTAATVCRQNKTKLNQWIMSSSMF